MILITSNQKLVKLDRNGLRRDVRKILDLLGTGQRELSLMIVDDEGIRTINRDYLRRDRPTNVIAFSLTEGDFGDVNPGVLGDVVVSVETAAREARAAGIPVEDAILYLIIHGILHLQAMTTRGPKGSPGPASCPRCSKPSFSKSGATGWTSGSSRFGSAPRFRVRVLDLEDLAALELSPREIVHFLDLCGGRVVALGDLGQGLPLLDRVLDHGRLRSSRFLGFALLCPMPPGFSSRGCFTGILRIFPSVTWLSLFSPLAERRDFDEVPNFFEIEASVSPLFTLYLTTLVLRSRSGGAGGLDSLIWSATSAYC